MDFWLEYHDTICAELKLNEDKYIMSDTRDLFTEIPVETRVEMRFRIAFEKAAAA